MNYCKLCRNGEHGDYGNGQYTKVKHLEYNGIIQICKDHLDNDGPLIEREYKTVTKKIPFHAEPNQWR